MLILDLPLTFTIVVRRRTKLNDGIKYMHASIRDGFIAFIRSSPSARFAVIVRETGQAPEEGAADRRAERPPAIVRRDRPNPGRNPPAWSGSRAHRSYCAEPQSH